MEVTGADDVLTRAVTLLEALAGMPQPASLASVVARTGLSKSKVYRALRALQDLGYVDRSARGGYRIGVRSTALSLLIGPRPALLAAARPIARRLSQMVDASVTVHLRSGNGRVLVLGFIPHDRPIGELPPLGERAPIQAGCSGLAILAYLPESERLQIRTARTTAGRWPTQRALDAILADGYALSFGGNHPGANGVAAPLLDPSDGYPLGSLAVAGPARSLPEQRLREHAVPLRTACEKLAPHFAKALGANSTRLAALDITIRSLVDELGPARDLPE